MAAWARLRRTIAQRGLRHALGKVWRRLRERDPATPAHAGSRTGTHPFDEATGLDTAGLIHGSELATGHPHDVYSVSYYGTAPSLFRAVAERWQQTPGTGQTGEYTFIDFGCGKGRVVLLAAEMGFREAIGVELNPGLAETARENASRWIAMGRARSAIRIDIGDAAEFAFPPGACLVYLFNPFTGKVLERLLDSIANAFRERPGACDLIYVNAEFGALLAAHSGFELLWEMPVKMSEEDAAADLLYLADEAGQKEYGEPGQEACSGWRWVG